MASAASKTNNILCKECNKKIFSSPISCKGCTQKFHPSCAKTLNGGKSVNSSTFTCPSCGNTLNKSNKEQELALKQKDKIIQSKNHVIKMQEELIEQLCTQVKLLQGQQVKKNGDSKSEVSPEMDADVVPNSDEERKKEDKTEEVKNEDAVDDSASNFYSPSLQIEDTPDTLNILLMGETGVGKSTFINSFANYVSSKSFDVARKTKATVLIPTRVTVYDAKTKEDCNLKVGFDKNERQEVGSSATQSVKTYIFPTEKGKQIRLIDTPGLGDTEGVERDNQNCEEILAYLAQLQKINAICLVMKPTNDRNTTLFSYCVQRVLSQFHKSACNNVVFVFTNAKGSDYTPGSTLPILKEMTKKMTEANSDIVIPVDKKNVFCLDNESFKHLLALEHGVTLPQRTMKSCKESWEISCDEIRRFMKYIVALPPHNLKKTVSINKTKDLVLQLSKPLSDISQLLQEKITQLEEKHEESKKTNLSIEELQKKLYKSTVDLKVVTLDHAVLVCTDAKCVKPVKVGNATKFQYTTKCHDPCLTGRLNYEVLGHWSIRTCSEMTTWSFTCKHCQCPGTKHMNIFYDTEIVEKQIVDEKIQSNITNEKKQREELDRIVKILTEEKNELDHELKYISKCAATFAYYLQRNSLSSSYDYYREYMYLSLENQKSLGEKANMNIIANLTDALEKYDKSLEILKVDHKLENGEKITDESVHNDAEKLFKLKHMGPKIREIFDARAKCAKNGIKANLKAVTIDKIKSWWWKK